MTAPTTTTTHMIPSPVDSDEFSPYSNMHAASSSKRKFEQTISSDDDDEQQPKAKRKRMKYTNEQVAMLEKIYERDPLPNLALREELARELKRSPRSVQIWFQNKRAKDKKLMKPMPNNADAATTTPSVVVVPQAHHHHESSKYSAAWAEQQQQNTTTIADKSPLRASPQQQSSSLPKLSFVLPEYFKSQQQQQQQQVTPTKQAAPTASYPTPTKPQATQAPPARPVNTPAKVNYVTFTAYQVAAGTWRHSTPFTVVVENSCLCWDLGYKKMVLDMPNLSSLLWDIVSDSYYAIFTISLHSPPRFYIKDNATWIACADFTNGHASKLVHYLYMEKSTANAFCESLAVRNAKLKIRSASPPQPVVHHQQQPIVNKPPMNASSHSSFFAAAAAQQPQRVPAQHAAPATPQSKPPTSAQVEHPQAAYAKAKSVPVISIENLGE